jgi:hypothetical protein
MQNGCVVARAGDGVVEFDGADGRREGCGGYAGFAPCALAHTAAQRAEWISWMQDEVVVDLICVLAGAEPGADLGSSGVFGGEVTG